MTNNKIVFAKIDKIRKSINSFAIQPDFSKEISDRDKRKPPEQLTDPKLLEIFTTLIAFSGQAPSDKVKLLIDAKIFNEIFYDFDVAKVALLNPCDLVDKYWDKITPSYSPRLQRGRSNHLCPRAGFLHKDLRTRSLLCPLVVGVSGEFIVIKKFCSENPAET